MPKIKTGHTRISFDFRTPEGAIQFWENFKDENLEWKNVGLVVQDALHRTPSNGNTWLVNSFGKPVTYEQEFEIVFSIDIGNYPGLNVEV